MAWGLPGIRHLTVQGKNPLQKTRFYCISGKIRAHVSYVTPNEFLEFDRVLSVVTAVMMRNFPKRKRWYSQPLRVVACRPPLSLPFTIPRWHSIDRNLSHGRIGRRAVRHKTMKTGPESGENQPERLGIGVP